MADFDMNGIDMDADDIGGFSPRSDFSISTDSSFGPPQVDVPAQTSPPPQEIIVTQCADMPDFTLNSWPEPAFMSCECFTCVDLIDRLYAVPAHEFAGPDLQAAVLQHFQHHDPLVPMKPRFRGFVRVMSAIWEQIAETNNVVGLEKLDIQDYNPVVKEALCLLPQGVSMEIAEMVDLEDDAYDRDDTTNMSMILDFDDYIYNPEANGTSQDHANKVPHDQVAFNRFANASLPAEPPAEYRYTSRRDVNRLLAPNNTHIQSTYKPVQNQRIQKTPTPPPTPHFADNDNDSRYSSSSSSSSSLSYATHMSMATDSNTSPSRAALTRQRQQAYMEAKTKAAPFAYLRGKDEPVHVDHSERKVAHMQRVDRWIDVVEAAQV